MVTNNLFLGFWTARSIDGFSQGQYIGVYATLGGAQAGFSFMTSFIVRSVAHFPCLSGFVDPSGVLISLVGIHASLSLFKAPLNDVLRSPTSPFDTTPMGELFLGVCSKFYL